MFTPEQRKFWREKGYLHQRDFLAAEEKRRLVSWVEEITNWPETPGKWMRYYEKEGVTENERRLARIENFLPYHPALAQFLDGSRVREAVSELMGETACLFKEKINFKSPGGGGFTAHQDAPAFTSFGHTYHVTLMLAIDAADLTNGCLEMVEGAHREGLLPQAADGTLHPECIKKLKWKPISVESGDIILFDSYIPHRSNTNCSERFRRAMFVTYNRLSEGKAREDYFSDKRRVFPPECERIPGKDYTAAGPYNLGNPIK